MIKKSKKPNNKNLIKHDMHLLKQTYPASQFNISSTLVHHNVMDVINRLQEKQFEAYIVGGGIRDLLLKRKPKDFDIVTNATPEVIRKIFKRQAIIIGKRFKIVHIVFNNINFDRMVNNRATTDRHIIEVSTYRSQNIEDHAINNVGRVMVDNDYGTQNDDALRRDFTINALYYDPIKEIIIDYHNGLDDVSHKSLKMIGDPKARYTEDPVRVLRAIRLSVKLGFTIEDKTYKAINSVKKLLINENKNRIYEEMLKILLSGSSYDCILYLQNIEIPKAVFPLLSKLFFGNHVDQMAINVLQKTDLRLKEHNSVSLSFLLSALMWNIIDNYYQKFLLQDESPRAALMLAINKNRDYASKIAINRNTYSAITDVWLLQYDLENPQINKIDKIFYHKRFRQAFHLYNLRHEFAMVDGKINVWWNKYEQIHQDDAHDDSNTVKIKNKLITQLEKILL